MSASTSSAVHSAVMPVYTHHSATAVCLILGRRPSVMGPGTSDLNRCLAPTPRIGNTAMNSTTMPMPPTQWVRQRHRLVARDRPSTSATTVPPEVVKPETASKTAAIGSGIEPSSTIGSPPTTPSRIHVNATVPSASLRWISCGVPPPSQRSTIARPSASAVVVP